MEDGMKMHGGMEKDREVILGKEILVLIAFIFSITHDL